MRESKPLEPFVQALLERQAQEGISGNAFARRLGVDSSMWSLVSRGERRAARKVIDGALRLYPDLAPLLVPELSIDNSVAVIQQGAA